MNAYLFFECLHFSRLENNFILFNSLVHLNYYLITICLTVVGECQRGDGGGVLVELAQPLLVEAVPNVDKPVRPTRGEGVVPIVKTGARAASKTIKRLFFFRDFIFKKTLFEKLLKKN